MRGEDKLGVLVWTLSRNLEDRRERLRRLGGRSKRQTKAEA